MGLVKDLLVRFVRDETSAAGFSKGVLGLSGGVDSAVSAALTVEALGPQNTLGVILPYRTGNPESVAHAATVATVLGIRTETVDISPMVDAYCERHDVRDPVRRGNVMARMRMIVLYDTSAREKALVIGTSNKSEILLGYGTLHGDLASAINPLGDLYKTQIWHLAKLLKIPEVVVTKAPSADLWEGQTDEGELGFTYGEVDALLYAMVDERRKDNELEAMGFKQKFIAKVRRLMRDNQFKRRPPVIAKISHRTVNVDFRYVRDWGK
ncbi:MAG: NAD+ synthase [Proteobacteria bacterium]|nr:NAD+ synthase [Pseudomonadota bacterium]